jgi:hypothetical protein
MRPAVNKCIGSVSTVRIKGVESLAATLRSRSRARAFKYSNEVEGIALAGKLFLISSQQPIRPGQARRNNTSAAGRGG